MFFKHFAGKNQLPGFYISGTLVENGLNNGCLLYDEIMMGLNTPAIFCPTFCRSHYRSSRSQLLLK